MRQLSQRPPSFPLHQIVAGLSQEGDDWRLRHSKRTQGGTGNRFRRTTASKRPRPSLLPRKSPSGAAEVESSGSRARGADIASLASQMASVDSELTATSDTLQRVISIPQKETGKNALSSWQTSRKWRQPSQDGRTRLAGEKSAQSTVQPETHSDLILRARKIEFESCK